MPSFSFETKTITYTDRGHGPALLLIPGLGGQMSFWAGVTEELKSHFRVISYDHPGSGGSEPLTDARTIDRLAQVPIALLDHLRVEKTHVIGQSMGGAIAQVMARGQTARIDRLVLSSTWCSLDDSMTRGFSLRQQILDEMGIQAYAKAQVLSTMSAKQIAVDPAKALAWEEKTIANSDPSSLQARINAILQFDNGGGAENIANPTLVFGTADDQVVPVHAVKRLAEVLPQSECCLVPSGGHFMPMTAPKPYANHILPFLQGKPVSGPERSIVIIGCGAIGQRVLEGVNEMEGVRIRAVLVRPERKEHYKTQLGSEILVASDVQDLSELQLDYAIECGGHMALQEFGPGLLHQGIDLAVLSAGALAQIDLFNSLKKAAETGHAQFDVLPGALAGVDALQALRQSGLDEVYLTSRKPPQAWKGSAAEEAMDLDNCSTPTRFFSGSAHEAAATYPKNANVAAIVALAGIGWDDTRVELFADPTVTANTHEITAYGPFGKVQSRIEGKPLPGNPRSSAMAALSALAAIQARFHPNG